MPEGITNTINPDLLTWDLAVIVVVLVVTFAWFYTRGRDFIVTTIVGAYVSATVFAFAPIASSIDTSFGFGLEAYHWRFLLFIICLAIFAWIMSTNGYFEPYIVPSGWEMAIFAILFAGLVLTIGVQMAPEEFIQSFSPVTRLLFAHEVIATGWLVAPIAVLLLIRGDT